MKKFFISVVFISLLSLFTVGGSVSAQEQNPVFSGHGLEISDGQTVLINGEEMLIETPDGADETIFIDQTTLDYLTNQTPWLLRAKKSTIMVNHNHGYYGPYREILLYYVYNSKGNINSEHYGCNESTKCGYNRLVMHSW
ncbi:hypothetical protein [Carnobacterium maltaromaticum]